jgi:hypothetical protein
VGAARNCGAAQLDLRPRPYLLIQSIVMTIAGGIGDYTTAALRGSSYYKLPKVLQWLSGNIGFHQIHHLSPRIPNCERSGCASGTSNTGSWSATLTCAGSPRSAGA